MTIFGNLLLKHLTRLRNVRLNFSHTWYIASWRGDSTDRLLAEAG
jgi:hypothetical protein